MDVQAEAQGKEDEAEVRGNELMQAWRPKEQK